MKSHSISWLQCRLMLKEHMATRERKAFVWIRLKVGSELEVGPELWNVIKTWYWNAFWGLYTPGRPFYHMNFLTATQHKRGCVFHVRRRTVQGMMVLRRVKINLIDMAILFVKMSHFVGMVSESWKIASEEKNCLGRAQWVKCAGESTRLEPCRPWHGAGLPNCLC